MNQLSRYDNCNVEGVPYVKIDLHKIEEVYRQCQTENLTLDVATGSFIIKELAKECRENKTNDTKWRRFLDEIYHEMKALNLVPLQKSLNCMIDLYGKRHEFKKMISLFREMKKNGTVDTVTFNCLLKHTGGKSMEEMMKFYALMKKMNIPPNRKTFESIAFGLTRPNATSSKNLPSHVNTILADLLVLSVSSKRVTTSLLKLWSKFDTEEVAQAVKSVEAYRTAPDDWKSPPSLFLLM